jgi:hypothetical protein
MVRVYLAAIFVLALVAHLGSASPAAGYIDHPWCTGGGGWSGALTCSFDSYEQCRANARTCVANPASAGYPQSQRAPAGANPRR